MKHYFPAFSPRGRTPNGEWARWRRGACWPARGVQAAGRQGGAVPGTCGRPGWDLQRGLAVTAGSGAPGAEARGECVGPTSAADPGAGEWSPTRGHATAVASRRPRDGRFPAPRPPGEGQGIGGRQASMTGVAPASAGAPAVPVTRDTQAQDVVRPAANARRPVPSTGCRDRLRPAPVTRVSSGARHSPCVFPSSEQTAEWCSH